MTMKNQYCKICGTLLPEDGVCLRCGAVYHFADDGTLIEPVRKVKKVSVKPAKKKGIIVKRAIDSSEAETKTIPIPEELFSDSKQVPKAQKRTDWTGSENASFKKESAYTPNFVLLDEKPPSYNTRNAEGYSEPERAKQQNQVPFNDNPHEKAPSGKPKNTISSGVLFAVFLVSALLAGLMMYYFLGSRMAENADSALSTTESSSTADVADSTKTALPIETFLTFTVKSMTYSSGDEGDFSSTYSFDKSSGRLTINNSSWGQDFPVLFPLIEGESMVGKHLSLSVIDDEMYASCAELFCESELITKGILKEIHIFQNDGTAEEEIIYQFTVESGRLTRAFITYKTEYFSGDSDARKPDTEITIIDYIYDDNNRLIKINSETDSENEGLHWSTKKDLKYSKEGLLTGIISKDEGLDGGGTQRVKLFYTDKKLSKSTSGDSSATFTYDEQGRLSDIRFASNWDESISYLHFDYSDSNEIKTISQGSAYGGKTYTYEHSH